MKEGENLLDGMDKRQIMEYIGNLERLVLYYVPEGAYDMAAWQRVIVLLEKLKEAVSV